MTEDLFSNEGFGGKNQEIDGRLLKHFANFSKRIFNCRDFKAILTVLHEELRSLYPHHHIEVILSRNQQMPMKFLFNEKTRRVVSSGEFLAKETLYNYVLERCKTVFTRDYAAFCRQHQIPAAIPARGWLGIPMTVRGKMLGALVVWNEDPQHMLDNQDKSFLTSLANMVSFAIENIYLYDYIVEKNGSFKIFDTVLPKGTTRNSVKSVLAQLLQSALRQHHVLYTGLFLGSRQNMRWRLLDEAFEDAGFSTAGIDLVSGLPYVPPAVFEEADHLFWHEDYMSHPLNPVLNQPFEAFDVNSALFFPFGINGTYIGAWIIGFQRDSNAPPPEDEIQMYRFLFYVMTQLIEKKAFMEQTRRYGTYMKHLEKMKILGELSSATAHNLNNILSVIMGKTQLLQRRLENTPYRRDLEMLLRAAEDGANSIRRLQEYSSSGKISGEPETININVLIQEVVDIARPRFENEAQSHGIHYDLDLSFGEVKPFSGDATTMREVMLNLINNALDAMPGGGKLSIQTTLKEDQILIFVSDTGSGIDPDISAKIFEPFYTTKGNKGNGLGLSIAAEIIEKHDGKIYVDSIPEKGSIFMIELPASGEEILPKAPAPELFNPMDYKVLLVENKTIVRETLAEMLEDEGCEVRAVSNANEALAEFQKAPCDVVFANLSMPVVNGVELAEKLKDIDPTIPVFIITGWTQLDESLLASEIIDGLIKKPFNMERIRQEILPVMSRKTRQFYKNGFSV